ncbi:MAG TPA: protein phosphatase 2C domain-containing protein [Thermoanaerobaculia bacterium]|jgi:serine/threonine protein phosphatase PrpC|nr:protein phosphatase 2C domain-containing protein [Thermoanaerobaculia bacterium]
MKFRWHAAGVTDVGRLRRNDEDAYLVDADEGLFAVADGVGGSRAGDVASRLAVETAARVLREERASPSGEAEPAVIGRMFSAAHRAIIARAAADPRVSEMATTLVLLHCDGDRAWIAHSGDSRVYRWRDGTLERLSRDHSFAEELQKAAGVEVRAKSPFGHVLTRCLGREGSWEPDVREIDVVPGDRFLLCCDGLTDMVDEPELAALLSLRRPPEETGRRLIDSANAAGGKDNITAVVVDFREP